VHVSGPLRMLPIAQPGGEVHPILRLREDVDAAAAWAELPPLDGANLFDRLAIKDNASVVAEADNAQRSPLLVLGAWGLGRTAALAVDSTWHWQLEGFGELHRRFWRQLILWLAQKDETEGRRVWVRLDQRRFQQGARVEFAMGAENDEGQPLSSAEYDVRIEKPDGTIDTARVTPRSGESTAAFSQTSQPGDYRIRVAAADGGAPVGDATARFSVSDQDVELDQPAAEPTLLAALARITADAGGDGMAPEELPGLLEQLKSKARSFEEEIVRTVTLWDTWPALLAFVGLLTTEWFLRKRWGIA
ncbi:MAG: glutamine amidotransferase, partial [Planctomycetota bacterium]